MPDIASWLSRLGLDKYVRVFTENEIVWMRCGILAKMI